MSLDLGTPIFEVALGLSFVFFLFSLVISSAVEGIAKIFQVREKKLEEGVKLMLGDKELAGEVIESPLFRADVTGKRKHRPAYVSSRNFALSLTRILRARGANAAQPNPVGQVEAGLDTCTPSATDQLKGLLEEASEDGGSLGKFRASVERWFDDGMDRVSGWYRGWTQVWTCVLALAVAVGLNVDAIRIGERLADDTALRTTVVEQAQTTAEKEPSQPEGAKTPTEAGEGVASALNEVEALNLPILWGAGNDTVDATAVVGWLITFLALSLGAPFWFDALSKLAHLKTTGKKPQPAT
jgi:hypothetical protein